MPRRQYLCHNDDFQCILQICIWICGNRVRDARTSDHIAQKPSRHLPNEFLIGLCDWVPMFGLGNVVHGHVGATATAFGGARVARKKNRSLQ